MTWVKVDEGMPENPKIIGLGPAVKWAHVEAICYCARNMTDGRVPAAAARRMATATGIRQLVEAGLWERDGSDYIVHDYLEYNPSRAEVMEQRAQAQAIRSAGGRARAAQAQRTGGRFTSSTPAGEPAARQQPAGSAAPAENQHRSDPDPTPIRTDPDPEIQNPPTPRSPRGGRPPVDEDFIAGLVVEFVEVFTEQKVRDEVGRALNHKSSEKWVDKRRGVRDWLKRESEYQAERAPTPIHRGPYLKPVPASAYEHLIHRGAE